MYTTVIFFLWFPARRHFLVAQSLDASLWFISFVLAASTLFVTCVKSDRNWQTAQRLVKYCARSMAMTRAKTFSRSANLTWWTFVEKPRPRGQPEIELSIRQLLRGTFNRLLYIIQRWQTSAWKIGHDYYERANDKFLFVFHYSIIER